VKLTVDASIAVKWFVAEPLCDEARTVLARRIQRQAPNLLIVEWANTIWKKARRGELADPQPYREELANLPDVVTLYPDRALVERATQVAFEIDHPIYDCLYLACAEATVSDLIIADKRFADKVAGRFPQVRVHDIGTPGVAGWIETMGTAPVIEQDRVDTLVAAYEAFAKTEPPSAEPVPGEAEDIPAAPIRNTPSWRRLANLVGNLNDEEYIDLLACGWFGAGLYRSWPQTFEHAERTFTTLGPTDAVRYGRHWRPGYSRAMAAVKAVRL
jgi:predicted nucleic acid-binding protein